MVTDFQGKGDSHVKRKVQIISYASNSQEKYIPMSETFSNSAGRS